MRRGGGPRFSRLNRQVRYHSTALDEYMRAREGTDAEDFEPYQAKLPARSRLDPDPDEDR